VYVEEYTRTGFRGGLNYYRNIDRNWERDPVRKFMPGAAMDGWVTDLRVSEVIGGAGHWLQQQAPETVKQHLLRWLADLT
jgi:pimeloyl-ACP methyl ester carboxylesterase